MIKKFIIICFAFALCYVNCFGQTPAVSYTTPNTFTVGSTIPTLSPSLTGLTVTAYGVSPGLPAGLSLNTTTGVISGVPSSANPITNYTITATTASGSKTFSLTITVSNPQPPIFTYPSPNTFNVDTTIPGLTPTVTSGTVTTYSISPVLPAGLSLDATTGKISGTPTGSSPATTYTITATYGAVHGTFNISITVEDSAVPKITYNTPNIFTYGLAIPPLSPTVTGGAVTSYSINPVPPSGLTLDPSSGVITGEPTAVFGSTNYVVTANTAVNGNRYANLQIQVNPSLPSSIYVPAIVDLTVDSTMKVMKPSGDTTNTYYALSPSNPKLPDGLRLNHKNGAIYGTPIKAFKSQIYSIVATHISGQITNYTINITIEPQPDIVALPPTISFVGQGNIQQSLNSGAAIAANTGIGVVYRQNSSERYGLLHDIEIDFSINVASTVDTIKSVNNSQNVVTNKQDFGNSVLLPLNSGQAFSFNFKGYFTGKGGDNGNFRRNAAPLSLGGVLSGFNIAFDGSNRNWEYDAYNAPNSTSTISPVLVKTSLLSFYVGPFFEFVTPSKANNYGQNSSITLGVGYSGRWILGDIQQSTQGTLRNELLGSTANSFNGAEITLALRFYNIKAEVHLPFFSNKDGIPGLTGTHLTTFIGFSGGFPIDLTKPSGQ